jgi:DNA-binding MarR family transcriptional regulator
MKSYKLIHQLLSLVEKLEEETNGAEVTLQHFTGFLVAEVSKDTANDATPDIRFGENEMYAQHSAYQLDNNIGRLFVYMSRYAKAYIKKALDGTPLQTGEDFTGLAILLTHDHLSKSELISRNLQEKTSGMEVIRRLIAAELVTQWDDADDKRGKRIAITDKGRHLMYRVFVDMSYVSQIITGKLTTSEKLTLQYLLQKLESFHYANHEQKVLVSKTDLKSYAASLPDKIVNF